MKIYKQYLRDKDKTPYGVAVLVHTDSFNHLGYSLVNPKADSFSKKRGTEIALNRAFCGRDTCPKVTERKLKIQECWFNLLGLACRKNPS